jgi:hypothetical protein
MRRSANLLLRGGIEMLVVAAITGSVVVSLRHRRIRRLVQEKRAMGEIYRVATALAAYAEKEGHLPRVGSLRTRPSDPKDANGRSRLPRVWPVQPDQSVALLLPELTRVYADYLSELPTRDPWGGQLLIAFSADFQRYTIVSTGADGRIDDQHLEFWDPDDDFRDIIAEDGHWFSSPAGTALRLP